MSRAKTSLTALILALGERLAVLVSTGGKVLATARLPAAPVAPPVVGDFDGDGISDVLVPVVAGHAGLRLKPSAGSLLLRILFGFLALAVVLVLVLRQQSLVPK